MLGVIADLDSRVTVWAEKLPSAYTVVRGDTLIINGQLVNEIGGAAI